MDMSRYNTGNKDVLRLERENKRFREYLLAIRENQDAVAAIFMALAEEPPNAWLAMEILEELRNEPKIILHSLSPTAGGIFHTWQRYAFKTGSLNNSYDVFQLAQTQRRCCGDG